MKKISPIDKMPETYLGWSKKDYIVCDRYNFHIGRTKDGKWVDMENKPIENVIFYCDLPVPSEEEYNNLRSKVEKVGLKMSEETEAIINTIRVNNNHDLRPTLSID